MKLVLSIGVCIALGVWPLAGILGSIMAGIAYGLLAPVMATFDAVGEGKSNQFLHCFMVHVFSFKFCFTILLLLAILDFSLLIPK